MTKYEALSTGEVPAGESKIVRLAGEEIGIFRLNDGSWRAYRNFCPHAGAPVCTGTVTAGPPPILRCPWHAWDFDLTTGKLVGTARCDLDSYRLEITNGTVFVWI